MLRGSATAVGNLEETSVDKEVHATDAGRPALK
jgi:hypothetical protein